MIIYPGQAFACTVLAILAVVSFHRDRRQPRAATVPLYLAALMAVGGPLATASTSAVFAQRDGSQHPTASRSRDTRRPPNPAG